MHSLWPDAIFCHAFYTTDVHVCECKSRAKQGSAFEGASEKSFPRPASGMDQGLDPGIPSGTDSSSLSRPVVVKRSCTEAMLKVRQSCMRAV